MKLREKMYAIKVAANLNAIVQDTIKNPNPLQYLKFNTLKSEVANTCFFKDYDLDIYKTFFTKSLDEWVIESIEAQNK